MATVTHHIYSHYDAQQRTALEHRTGQITEDKEDPWQTESSFGASRFSATPRFVPATTSYDDWAKHACHIDDLPRERGEPGQELAGWYRSMKRSEDTRCPELNTRISLPAPVQEPVNTKIDRKNKNNWFIMKAIQSEVPSASPQPPPTLADILARDPPPLGTEEKFHPPVWLHLGPSNKGFAMLQRSGWNEGEGLGATIVRRGNDVPSFADGRKRIQLGDTLEGKGNTERARNVPPDTDGQAGAIPGVDVIDLTLSDSDYEDSERGSKVYGDADIQSVPTPTHPSSKQPHSRKTLLTPIPIILKSDRLGIGLKAKTVGPFKASQKRVTHNAAAMAAHVRAAEEAKKKKLGRGRRGFQRAQRKAEEHRKRMLAYLNA